MLSNEHSSSGQIDGTPIAVCLGGERENHQQMKNFSTKIGSAVLTLAFIFGISAVTGMTAQAQNRRDRDRDGRQDRWRDRNDRSNNNQGQNRDWRQERERREEAIRRAEAIRREEAARQARVYNNGRYNNGVYNNGRYNNGVYNNGNYGTYGNNGGYGNYGGYNNQAQQQGYQYGLSTGSSDAQRGQSYSPQRSHYWKQASSQAFRAGFEQGYAQGYRQYGGYSNGRNNRSILGGIFGP